MSNNDPRQQERRSHKRRNQERRKINHPFGSEQWLKTLESEYLLTPKYERRKQDRRIEDRRSGNRRQLIDKPASVSNRFAWPHLLSDEERQMLNDLMQDD